MLFHKHVMGVAILVCLSLLVLLLPPREPEPAEPEADCAVDCQVLVEPEDTDASLTSASAVTGATPVQRATKHQSTSPACFTCSCRDQQRHQVILGPICNHEAALAERVEHFENQLEQIEAACEKLSQQQGLILDSVHAWQEE